MSFSLELGETFLDNFPVYESDGVTKKSGLSVGGGDFVVTLLKDCVVNALPVTITEIGSSGQYCASFVPDAVGIWSLEVAINYNQEHWVGDAVVRTSVTDITALLNQIISDVSDLEELQRRALGLLHLNSMVDKQTFDVNKQLKTARLRVFDSSVNLPSLEGGNETTGLLHEYAIEATWEAENKETKFSLRQVL